MPTSALFTKYSPFWKKTYKHHQINAIRIICRAGDFEPFSAKGRVHMSEYSVQGGNRISGELTVHGAKNSALPILAATLLTEESAIDNCPRLSDVEAACNILECLGCCVKREVGVVKVNARDATCNDIPDRLMGEMRSSILFLGAILARCGHARISFPGGCELGAASG